MTPMPRMMGPRGLKNPKPRGPKYSKLYKEQVAFAKDVFQKQALLVKECKQKKLSFGILMAVGYLNGGKSRSMLGLSNLYAQKIMNQTLLYISTNSTSLKEQWLNNIDVDYIYSHSPKDRKKHHLYLMPNGSTYSLDKYRAGFQEFLDNIVDNVVNVINDEGHVRVGESAMNIQKLQIMKEECLRAGKILILHILTATPQSWAIALKQNETPFKISQMTMAPSYITFEDMYKSDMVYIRDSKEIIPSFSEFIDIISSRSEDFKGKTSVVRVTNKIEKKIIKLIERKFGKEVEIKTCYQEDDIKNNFKPMIANPVPNKFNFVLIKGAGRMGDDLYDEKVSGVLLGWFDLIDSNEENVQQAVGRMVGHTKDQFMLCPPVIFCTKKVLKQILDVEKNIASMLVDREERRIGTHMKKTKGMIGDHMPFNASFDEIRFEKVGKIYKSGKNTMITYENGRPKLNKKRFIEFLLEHGIINKKEAESLSDKDVEVMYLTYGRGGGASGHVPENISRVKEIKKNGKINVNLFLKRDPKKYQEKLKKQIQLVVQVCETQTAKQSKLFSDEIGKDVDGTVFVAVVRQKDVKKYKTLQELGTTGNIVDSTGLNALLEIE